MKRVLLASAAALLAFAIPAAAQAGTGGQAPPAGVVSVKPPANVPHLPVTTSQVEQIRQLVQCGGTMYAVGTFTTIRRNSTTYTRSNVFSFSATAPYAVTSWAPNVVGTYGTTADISNTVNTIAFAGGNCANAYVGGTSGINGDTTDSYFASLNQATGKSDGFLHLNISGNYRFPGSGTNATHVYSQQLSPDRTRDLVEGDFTSVGGQSRQQAFMLTVSGSSATVTGWNVPEFTTNCAPVQPFYVQDGAWSPDGSTVYFGTTGYHPNGQPAGATPRSGPCDAALAFPATPTAVTAGWTNYTGCDSLYAAAADAKAVYFGGHERWSMNPADCDGQGPGAYPAPGLEGVDPATGALYLNAAGTAGYYTHDRGLGADNMLVTSAGLWIASDNFEQTQYCGGVSTSGICFLPYS